MEASRRSFPKRDRIRSPISFAFVETIDHEDPSAVDITVLFAPNMQSFPQDGPLVGTRAILDSPNVEAAPDRVNRPVDVPSVYEDARGSIHNLLVGAKRINLLSTEAGVMRSGDIHATTQHDFVFAGQVEVWTLQPNGTTLKQAYAANQYIAIPPYTPHIFNFIESTVMAEWWDDKFYAWFYRPHRDLVEASFVQPSAIQRPGRFLHYVQQTSKETSMNNQIWWTALVLGLSVGYMIGARRR